MVEVGRRTMVLSGVAIAAPAVLGGSLSGPLGSTLGGTLGERLRAGAATLLQTRIGQPYGARVGDVTTDSAVVWARSASPGRLMLRLRSNGRRLRSVRGPWATPDTDLTARVVLRGLPPGREYEADLWFATPEGATGEVQTVRFATAPIDRRPVSLAWSGDTCGQGWGINEAMGGMTGYRLVRDLAPDVFIHCGDHVYADEPINPIAVDLHGNVFRSVVTEETSKVAETLEEFRGRHRYVLTDHHVRDLYAEVPTIGLWDDHETLNNWYPGEVLHDRPEYTLERRCDVLAARGRRAFQEYTPIDYGRLGGRFEATDRIYRKVSRGPLLDVFCLDMRSYRDANGDNRSTDPGRGILGWVQEQWLLRELTLSRAVWKVVVADMPISVATARDDDRDSVAQSDDGPPLGREGEIARLLSGLKANRVRNVVWLTADVHYTAAHHYAPERATFTEFDPFWEFVSGPIAASTFQPKTPDATFGPEVVFAEGNTDKLLYSMSPAVGRQYVGQVQIARDGRLTVTLHSVAAGALWSTTLEPQIQPPPEKRWE